MSVICMLGYSFALGAWGSFDMAFLGGVLVVGLYIFIAYTSIKLFRFRKSAPSRLEKIAAVLQGIGQGMVAANANRLNCISRQGRIQTS